MNIMNSSRSTIARISGNYIQSYSGSTMGYVEGGRVMNSSRNTIGRYDSGRIMSYSGSTLFYLEGTTIMNSSRSSIGYTSENIRNNLTAVVAYIVFFSDWW